MPTPPARIPIKEKQTTHQVSNKLSVKKKKKPAHLHKFNVRNDGKKLCFPRKRRTRCVANIASPKVAVLVDEILNWEHKKGRCCWTTAPNKNTKRTKLGKGKGHTHWCFVGICMCVCVVSRLKNVTSMKSHSSLSLSRPYWKQYGNSHCFNTLGSSSGTATRSRSRKPSVRLLS